MSGPIGCRSFHRLTSAGMEGIHDDIESRMTGLASGKESTPVRTKQVWVAFADGVPAPFGTSQPRRPGSAPRGDGEAAVVWISAVRLGAFAG